MQVELFLLLLLLLWHSDSDTPVRGLVGREEEEWRSLMRMFMNGLFSVCLHEFLMSFPVGLFMSVVVGFQSRSHD
jgi:hypothetical protein